jgi:hypothetical protein
MIFHFSIFKKRIQGELHLRFSVVIPHSAYSIKEQSMSGQSRSLVIPHSAPRRPLDPPATQPLPPPPPPTCAYWLHTMAASVAPAARLNLASATAARRR